MATIIITITDTPNDVDTPVNIRVEHDPPIKTREPESWTDAQATSMVMVDAALKSAKHHRLNSVEP